MRMHAQAGAGRPMPAAAGNSERAKLATYVALFGQPERAMHCKRLSFLAWRDFLWGDNNYCNLREGWQKSVEIKLENQATCARRLSAPRVHVYVHVRFFFGFFVFRCDIVIKKRKKKKIIIIIKTME